MLIELCLASADERHRALPGDKLIASPELSTTHAVTIHAPRETVWPWLVQLGSGRAGWYSYDRIDNGGVKSAGRIIPELQHLEAGDVMPAIPGTKDAFIVRDLTPNKALVLVVPLLTASEEADARRRMTGPLRVSWALVLESLDHERTRLVSRGRVSRDWLAPNQGGRSNRPTFIERVYGLLSAMPWSLMLPIAMAGHYIMASRMLRGIKWRAERDRTDASPFQEREFG